MQTDWFIDFMTLAETRSFSRAAELRHVTQPAFSRRIKALETWAAADLVDRSSHPMALTQAGRLLLAQAPQLVGTIEHAHTLMHGQTLARHRLIRFVSPRALASSFFPAWIQGMEAALGGMTPHLSTPNAAEARRQLRHGECDLLLAYASPDLPIGPDPEQFEVLRLGSERLLPCSKPDATGQAMHIFPGTPHHSTPYMVCSVRTELGRLIALSLQRQAVKPHLQRVFETDCCSSLLAMALTGAGLAILPERSVRAELACTRLVQAGAPLATELDICLMRLRPTTGKTPTSAPLESFWRQLQGSRLPLVQPERGCAHKSSVCARLETASA